MRLLRAIPFIGLAASLEQVTLEPDTASLLQHNMVGKQRATTSPSSFKVEMKGLIPEGIATLPNGDFLLGSAGGLGLQRAKVDGDRVVVTPFAQTNDDKSKNILGVHVSSTRVVAAVSPNFIVTEAGLMYAVGGAGGGILVYDFEGKFECFATMADKTQATAINDLTVQGGKIYATEMYTGSIWESSMDCKQTKVLTTLKVGAAGDDPIPGKNGLINGIDSFPASTNLLVSVIGKGLFKVYNNQWGRYSYPVPHLIPGSEDYTVDGLVVVNANLAYGVTGRKVVKLTSTNKFDESFLAEGSDDMDCEQPTTLTLRGTVPWVACAEGFGEGPYFIEQVKWAARQAATKKKEAGISPVAASRVIYGR